ncbi:MAG: GGDEF domain-containing response regulator [Chlamydiia bacterium]
MSSRKKPKLLFAHGPGDPDIQLEDGCFRQFEVIRAPSYSAAIQLVREQPFHLILVDENLMNHKAIELCMTLHRRTSVPVLIQCATPTSRAVQQALQAGAQDFVCRPARPNELKARAELASTARSSADRVMRMVRSLTDLSKRDALTQLYNRSVLEEEIPHAIASGHMVQLLMLDVDHFKSINDTFGHLTGDAVLTELARLLEEHLRRTDMVIRYGGEEFVIFLPACTAEAAQNVAEKIRRRVQQHRFYTRAGVVSITVSIGVTGTVEGRSRTRPQQASERLLARVDKALYLAKQHGRNSVWFLPPHQRK